MKKNYFILFLFIVIGLVVGIIIGELLAPVKALSFLTKSVGFSWEPKADLNVIKYNIDFEVKLNLCAVIGLAGAIWLYRKL
ncbi:DUF4321 domain-containing protein [Paenibacillus sp. N1-5-1-14]|uniref:DUF4321 domain-containing protein n=1 Tax=Paenibacillus radicibacter TaxID=2972488 RepID=UPI0021590ECD|nr:DUF4321 domain-containing protein [Paenibacillus radicibacter]MCR8644148.1 DUF4321 domain-containing protein [Paenibacillus radicibacter]